MDYRVIVGGVFLSLHVAACTAPGEMPFQGRWAPPEEPGLSLREVSGRELRQTIRSADAELVLVNVWATWCTSCREEFPALLEVRRYFAPRGVAVVIVSGDFLSERQSAFDFLESMDVRFPTYIKAGKDMDFIDALQPDWSGALPATFLFLDGEVVDWWQGAATFERFAAAVEGALERGASSSR